MSIDVAQDAAPERIDSVGRPASSHACHPPISARALGHPALRSWSATRALVASSRQAQ
jgi:hypothetical protein